MIDWKGYGSCWDPDGLDVADARFLLFSPVGFPPSLRARAGDGDVQLVDLNRPYAGD